MIMPPTAHGVKVISIGMFTKDNTPVVWRGPMLHRALQQFLADVFWGDLVVQLLDLPPGTGALAIPVAPLIPHAETPVCTTPQPAAQRQTLPTEKAEPERAVRLGGVAVDELARRYGTPLFVVDEADFLGRCAEHAAAFGDPVETSAASFFISSSTVAMRSFHDVSNFSMPSSSSSCAGSRSVTIPTSHGSGSLMTLMPVTMTLSLISRSLPLASYCTRGADSRIRSARGLASDFVVKRGEMTPPRTRRMVPVSPGAAHSTRAAC